MKAILSVLLCFLPVMLSAQIITTVAGTGVPGYSGDGGICLSATFNTPQDIAFDNLGNLYVADKENHVVRKINTIGIISTVAGSGVAGYNGDGALATSANLKKPTGVALDASGNLYIADCLNHVIRKVNTTGIISTIAGTGVAGYSGDGNAATLAELKNPYGIVVDNFGNIYFSETSNSCVRKINTLGIITTIAGTGISGYNGDGIPATTAKLKFPGYLTIGPSGDIYIPDWSNHRIRKVDAIGIITTVAGSGVAGYSGDGGLATAAELNAPNAVQFDNNGNLIISDTYSNVLRKVNTSGIISTIAGNGSVGFSGDAGIATSAQLNTPDGIAVNPAGNIFFADQGNAKIRKITYNPDAVNDINSTSAKITIYPNPAQNMVTITADASIGNAVVINMLGQVVKETLPTSDTREVTLIVSNLPAGIYFVKVNGLYAGRFVKE